MIRVNEVGALIHKNNRVSQTHYLDCVGSGFTICRINLYGYGAIRNLIVLPQNIPLTTIRFVTFIDRISTARTVCNLIFNIIGITIFCHPPGRYFTVTGKGVGSNLEIGSDPFLDIIEDLKAQHAAGN